MGYSPDGTLLCSLGEDNTIFFFEVSKQDDPLLPMGFVQIPCRVNQVTWHQNNRVLLSLDGTLDNRGGTIVELTAPTTDQIDNSESYATRLDYRAVVPELPEIESEDEEEEEGAEGE